ncbi:MAG: hypothetical protein ISS79_11260 [Phycisphaerae bacterium]|nr:hypothetical protein [Phycisphaerae bacterium]
MSKTSKPCGRKKKVVGNAALSGAVEKPTSGGGENGVHAACSHRTPRQLHASTYMHRSS